jgi:YidC/Oxa1 family membrane protein insertase
MLKISFFVLLFLIESTGAIAFANPLVGLKSVSDNAGQTLSYSQASSSDGATLVFNLASGESVTISHVAGKVDVSTTSSSELDLVLSFKPEKEWLADTSQYARPFVFVDGDVSKVEMDSEDPIPASRLLGIAGRIYTLAVAAEVPLQLEKVPAPAEEMDDVPLEALLVGVDNLSRSSALSLSIYDGIKSKENYQEFDSRLMELFYWDFWEFLRWFCFGIGFVVNQIFLISGNWIVTIFAMAILIRIVIHPVAAWGLKSQEKTKAVMAKIKPQLDEIDRDFKGLEKNEKVLDVYKQHGISPFAGMKSMLPLMLQIPFFIALYAILNEEFRLSVANFLWITDLSQPDMLFELPFSIPLLGIYINLLPILMGAVSVIGAMTSPTSSGGEKSSLYIMAAMFTILFYNFPAGLVLYWTLSNLLQTTHQSIRVYRAGGA